MTLSDAFPCYGPCDHSNLKHYQLEFVMKIPSVDQSSKQLWRGSGFGSQPSRFFSWHDFWSKELASWELSSEWTFQKLVISKWVLSLASSRYWKIVYFHCHQSECAVWLLRCNRQAAAQPRPCTLWPRWKVQRPLLCTWNRLLWP